jgi:diguanylate cyclase (GGDEF)-like protein
MRTLSASSGALDLHGAVEAMNSALTEYLERSSGPSLVGISVMVLALLGFLDLLVGWEIRLSVLYLLPVGLAAWYVNWKAGLGLSIAGVLVTLLAGWLAGQPYSRPVVTLWNSLAQFGLFATVSYLAFALRQARRRQEHLAQVDSLTGLKRSELFYELVGRQVKIAVRHNRPLTFAYIGTDSFKALNREYGRQAGDDVLISVAQALKQNLRETDIVARVGGDEFAVFFPETGTEHAKQVIEKVLLKLGEATEGWPITFSLGAMVCDHAACSMDTLVQTAEGLMRSVKKSGVNNYELQVFKPEPDSGG